jgi:hypothetical protein
VSVKVYPLFFANQAHNGALISHEPQQSYTTALPKNLWLAVNEEGIHILRRRTKDPLISYAYRNIVNYSPSLRNLMIVTESLTRGTKFVFNTSQVRAARLRRLLCCLSAALADGLCDHVLLLAFLFWSLKPPPPLTHTHTHLSRAQ